MRTPSLVTASVLGISALLLSACSGGGETTDDGGKRLTLNSIMGGPDWDNVDWQDVERRVQEAIAECMRAEGWEYIPVEQPDGVYEYTPEDELANYKKQGFGIAYWTLYQGTEEFDDPWAGWTDPNTEYVNSLTEAEVTAYYETLYGTQAEQEALQVREVDPETGEEYYVQYGWGAGCQGKAYQEVYGDDPTQTPEYQEAMMQYWDELGERYNSDPRIVELEKKWAQCMKKAGYEYESQEDFWNRGYQAIQERHDEIVPDLYSDPFEGWTDEEINTFFETSTQEEIDALFNKPYDLTPEQRSALEELLQEEIALAVAQFECSKPLNEQMSEIYADIEEKFVLEHEDELRALAAQLSGTK